MTQTSGFAEDRVWSNGLTTGVPEAEGMSLPVRCAFCRRIYDLGTVEVTGRYVDCSVWRTPCCNITADDRGDSGWKSKKDYYRLTRRGNAWVES